MLSSGCRFRSVGGDHAVTWDAHRHPSRESRRSKMPRYLWTVTYSVEGAKGLLAEGGTARRDAITQMVESVGGTVEACYYALGERNLFVIGEVPDEVAAAALEIRTAASGAARSEPVVLLTPEQVDEAVRRETEYRVPGS